MTICQFDGCTRELLPGSRYCRFCQRKGTRRDYQQQSLLHTAAVQSRQKRETATPEPWEILLGYCDPFDVGARGATYTYAIGLYKYVKFGQAIDVTGRLMTLQIANPHRLRILGKIASSRELEHHLHDALREHVYRGEWFKLNDTTREFIRLMRADDLEGVCKKASMLISAKMSNALVHSHRYQMMVNEQGPVLV
jgi:hypothetical protein